VVTVVACSSAPTSESGDTFAENSAMVLTTETGSYRIALHSAPDAQPSRGVNALRLIVTRAVDGTPASGLTLAIVPFMPAMGHGASTTPSVAADPEPGSYTVRDVNLFMPGLWEIRATIGGDAPDHATAQFDVR
jgi:hypothetical protein